MARVRQKLDVVYFQFFGALKYSFDHLEITCVDFVDIDSTQNFVTGVDEICIGADVVRDSLIY